MRLPRPTRFALVALLTTFGLTIAAAVGAWAPGAIIVHSRGEGPVRLQVSEGPGAECDSSLNRLRFDGPIAPNQTLSIPISGSCACVRSTSVAFPDLGWDSSRLACEPIPNDWRTRYRYGNHPPPARFGYELIPP